MIIANNSNEKNAFCKLARAGRNARYAFDRFTVAVKRMQGLDKKLNLSNVKRNIRPTN